MVEVEIHGKPNKNGNTVAANVDKDNTFNAYMIKTKQVLFKKKKKYVTEQYNTSAQNMNGSTITYPLKWQCIGILLNSVLRAQG